MGEAQGRQGGAATPPPSPRRPAHLACVRKCVPRSREAGSPAYRRPRYCVSGHSCLPPCLPSSPMPHPPRLAPSPSPPPFGVAPRSVGGADTVLVAVVVVVAVVAVAVWQWCGGVVVWLDPQTNRGVGRAGAGKEGREGAALTCLALPLSLVPRATHPHYLGDCRASQAEPLCRHYSIARPPARYRLSPSPSHNRHALFPRRLVTLPEAPPL
ncbi:hypothetical protein O3P69_018779 [Scylla paramamosain]|uniref:Uncharacterized protein n=1 Tax=Scylla paramamosain TaxID=85552 RepID=A0AAW0SST6_SCYPA